MNIRLEESLNVPSSVTLLNWKFVVRRVECEYCHRQCQEHIDWIPRYQHHTEQLYKHIEHRTEEEYMLSSLFARVGQIFQGASLQALHLERLFSKKIPTVIAGGST